MIQVVGSRITVHHVAIGLTRLELAGIKNGPVPNNAVHAALGRHRAPHRLDALEFDGILWLVVARQFARLPRHVALGAFGVAYEEARVAHVANVGFAFANE